ncbi:MAG: hypothetical protein Q8R92_20590, partial [Deltaproteobacteria bacterium]|nr:hypothetical protein [Deltaproteobacteria bacterium]
GAPGRSARVAGVYSSAPVFSRHGPCLRHGCTSRSHIATSMIGAGLRGGGGLEKLRGVWTYAGIRDLLAVLEAATAGVPRTVTRLRAFRARYPAGRSSALRASLTSPGGAAGARRVAGPRSGGPVYPSRGIVAGLRQVLSGDERVESTDPESGPGGPIPSGSWALDRVAGAQGGVSGWTAATGAGEG